MANKIMKIYSMLLDREMEIKNKMRSHYTTIRIAHKFLKTNKQK